MWNDCVIIDIEKKDSIRGLISGYSDQNCLIMTKITKNGICEHHIIKKQINCDFFLKKV